MMNIYKIWQIRLIGMAHSVQMKDFSIRFNDNIQLMITYDICITHIQTNIQI